MTIVAGAPLEIKNVWKRASALIAGGVWANYLLGRNLANVSDMWMSILRSSL